MSSLKSQQSASSAWEPETQGTGRDQRLEQSKKPTNWLQEIAQKNIRRIHADKAKQKAAEANKASAPAKQDESKGAYLYDAQKSFRETDFQVSIAETQSIPFEIPFMGMNLGCALQFRPGKLKAALDPGGVRISSSRGIALKMNMIPGDSFVIRALRFDFSTGKVRIEDSGAPWVEYLAKAVIPGLSFTSLSKNLIENAINAKIGDYLPSRLRRHGYNINQDDNLEATLSELYRHVNILAGVSPGKGEEIRSNAPGICDPTTKTAGKEPQQTPTPIVKALTNLTNATARARISAFRGRSFPLGDEHIFNVPEGSSIEVILDGTESANLYEPVMKSLTVRLGDNVTVKSAKTGEDLIRLHELKIEPGLKLSAPKYSFIQGDSAVGMVALTKLVALRTASPQAQLRATQGQDYLEDARSVQESQRAKTNEKFQKMIPLYLYELLAPMQKLLPGFSLASFLSLNAAMAKGITPQNKC